MEEDTGAEEHSGKMTLPQPHICFGIEIGKGEEMSVGQPRVDRQGASSPEG